MGEGQEMMARDDQRSVFMVLEMEQVREVTSLGYGHWNGLLKWGECNCIYSKED